MASDSFLEVLPSPAANDAARAPHLSPDRLVFPRISVYLVASYDLRSLMSSRQVATV